MKNGEVFLLHYHGSGNLTDDTRLKLTIDGFSLTTSKGQEPKPTPVTMETPADFVVIQSNKCDICVNGSYNLEDSIQRIGFFEFKGIVVYHAHFC